MQFKKLIKFNITICFFFRYLILILLLNLYQIVYPILNQKFFFLGKIKKFIESLTDAI